GVARVHFDSGPELVVEGPAALRLESATAATVLRGKVVFRADEMAPPFDLHTPSSTLVDLGTEYAAPVGPEGAEGHVVDGEGQRGGEGGARQGRRAAPLRGRAGGRRRVPRRPQPLRPPAAGPGPVRRPRRRPARVRGLRLPRRQAVRGGEGQRRLRLGVPL